ncbi:MAG: SDR family NAD(P)-dependent oxidoreductase [Pseudomonadota bacterium]
MQKKILITGSTDGIGLATAEMLLAKGHHVLLHGRNKEKLEQKEKTLAASIKDGSIESYIADLSDLSDVMNLAKAIRAKHEDLDVLINNAGILKTSSPITKDGLDVRFVVNTIAPYLLTQQLLPIIGAKGRVINLSSAAQASINFNALTGQKQLTDMEAYAQSKLALTSWSRSMSLSLTNNGPMIVAVNPGSLLASKMVQEGFGVAGSDISKGADILVRAALSDEFANATGKYFDNDAEEFSAPHADALDANKSKKIIDTIETLLAENLF